MSARRDMIDDLRRDVASFADPGTEVEIEPASGYLKWRRLGRDVAVRLVSSAGDQLVVDNAGRRLSIPGFLASEDLADLRQLAEAMLAAVRSPTPYVEGRICLDGSDAEPQPASASLRGLSVGDLPLTYVTRVVFLHGNAGAGKTSLLSHLVREQATKYVDGEAHSLFLYLDAQGKGLTQLEDVMARALQDLRARFTYHSVATLTRRRCIVPIIDGFDELIGPSSAREAFGNLSQFLAQLNKEGVVLASSRSAFIDYRTLHERASEIAAAKGLAYEITPAELQAWDENEVEDYAKRRAPENATLLPEVRRLLSLPVGQLLRKPFFLEQVCRIHLDGKPIRAEAGADLPKQVVEASLARESEKLKDQRGQPVLSVEQHRRWCELVAEEMWYEGVSELDTDTIRLIATMLGEDLHLDERALKMLVDRAGAHGLLVEAGSDSGKRRFEHELFRFEFQAGRFVGALVEGEDRIADLLERSEVPLEILDRVSTARPWTGEEIARNVATLGIIARKRSRNAFVGSNAGAFVAALIKNRSDIPENVQLTNLTMRVSALGEVVLRKAQLSECVFERVDFQKAQILDSVVSACKFVVCRVGEGTRFTGTAVDPRDFIGLMLGQAESYDPALILKRLKKSGAVLPAEYADAEVPDEKPVNEKIEFLEELLKHARTHFYLENDDPWVKRKSGIHAWEELIPLLKKHGLLDEVLLEKSGRPKPFLRFAVPPDVILRARVSGGEPAASFWREIERE